MGGKQLTAEQLKLIKQGFDEGKKGQEVADLAAAGLSTVQRVKSQIKKGNFYELLAKAQGDDESESPGGIKTETKTIKTKTQPTRDEALSNRQKVMELRGQGYGVKEIAVKLGWNPSRVNYYVYQAGKHKQHQDKEMTNGNSNGSGSSVSAFGNKQFVLGIAYSETERFLSVLSERLKIPTNLLRQRLSELLGHSPMRG